MGDKAVWTSPQGAVGSPVGLLAALSCAGALSICALSPCLAASPGTILSRSGCGTCSSITQVTVPLQTGCSALGARSGSCFHISELRYFPSMVTWVFHVMKEWISLPLCQDFTVHFTQTRPHDVKSALGRSLRLLSSHVKILYSSLQCLQKYYQHSL